MWSFKLTLYQISIFPSVRAPTESRFRKFSWNKLNDSDLLFNIKRWTNLYRALYNQWLISDDPIMIAIAIGSSDLDLPESFTSWIIQEL